MGNRLLAGALLLAGLAAGPMLPASAAAAASDFDAENFLADCAAGADRNCRYQQDVLREQWPKALAGDYGAQRNVAFCLADGCYGSVTVDALLACAFRIVILGSGVPELTQEDVDNHRKACIEGLTDQDHQLAKLVARKLFREIYRRDPS